MPAADLPREATVVRFPPSGPDEITKIRNEAKYVHRHRQQTQEGAWYRLSVWADVPRLDESEHDLRLRLVHAAGLGGLNLADVRNAFFWWTTAARLYDLGFEFKKDGDDDEPIEHYSVDLGGDEPTRATVEAFVSAFEGPEGTGEGT